MPTEPNPICFLNPNPEEPAMILYADDMVIWAETQEQLKEKMTHIARVMKKLRLKLSLSKTEVQHNRYQEPNLEGTTVTLEGELGEYKYKAMNKPIRYLGTWSTANLDNEGGLQILREKIEQKLTTIRDRMSNPWSKTKITKGKVQ